MKNLIIAIDQSTSATKAMLFNERCEMLKRVNVTHEQYYPRTGWVEHDVEEIYRNVLKSIAELIEEETADNMYSLAITNQRETVVVWNNIRVNRYTMLWYGNVCVVLISVMT